MAKIKKVRVTKTEFGTYQLNFTNHRGKQRRLSAGKDEEYAQRLRIKFQDWLNEGLNPETEMEREQRYLDNGVISLKTIFTEFMERHGASRSANMQHSYLHSFKSVCRWESLAETPLHRLSRRQVLNFAHERRQQDDVSAATVNRELAFISVMLTYAVRNDLIAEHPLQGMGRLKESGKRNVELTVDQAKTLIDALPGTLGYIVEFAIYSGFRKDNILTLQIANVCFHESGDFAEITLIIKGGRVEMFPVGPLAVEVLRRAIGERVEGAVFLNQTTGRPYRSIHKAFNRAVRDLGLFVNGTKFRFHDLRHVYATWLHRQGVSLDSLRALMGHKDRKTTDRYATIDRMAVGDQLSRMPRIRQDSENETAPSGGRQMRLIVAKN
jgi:integrase